MKIGYIRVSTQEQNTIRQEVLMASLGVDEVYIDRMSGKSTNRPELQKMMEYVRRGDTVIVESISRFARNTRDLLDLVEKLSEKGVEFVSKKEAIDTTTPTGKFTLTNCFYNLRMEQLEGRLFVNQIANNQRDRMLMSPVTLHATGSIVVLFDDICDSLSCRISYIFLAGKHTANCCSRITANSYDIINR